MKKVLEENETLTQIVKEQCKMSRSFDDTISAIFWL